MIKFARKSKQTRTFDDFVDRLADLFRRRVRNGARRLSDLLESGGKVDLRIGRTNEFLRMNRERGDSQLVNVILFTLRLRPVSNSPASSLTKFSRAACLSVTLLAESISCSYINSFPLLELLPWLRSFLTKLTPVNSSKLSLSKNSFAFLYRLFCTQEMLSLCRQSSRLWPAATTTVRIDAIANIFMTYLLSRTKRKVETRDIYIYTRECISIVANCRLTDENGRRIFPKPVPSAVKFRVVHSCNLFTLYIWRAPPLARSASPPHPVSFFFLFAVARDVSSQCSHGLSAWPRTGRLTGARTEESIRARRTRIGVHSRPSVHHDLRPAHG